jgi:hypothetical protein
MMKRVFFVVFISSPLFAEDDTDWARDFRLIRERSEACMTAATTYTDAVGCADRATRECKGEIGDWPYPEPRNCQPLISIWRSIYQTEVMVQLGAADEHDRVGVDMDSILFSGALNLAMRAELAWSAYASSVCQVERLNFADLTNIERRALPQDFCMERQYASRIFYLRSERNWLNDYRK